MEPSDQIPLCVKVVSALSEDGLTLAVAESCTGGLIAKKITDVPGSSAVFHGGVVSYVNRVKQTLLHVSRDDIIRFGAVSAPVSRQMAEGVRTLMHADLALSTTGVAGPDKDDFGNDVGTVYISIASEYGTHCYLCQFKGNREEIREAAAEYALELVLRHRL